VGILNCNIAIDADKESAHFKTVGTMFCVPKTLCGTMTQVATIFLAQCLVATMFSKKQKNKKTDLWAHCFKRQKLDGALFDQKKAHFLKGKNLTGF